ncbi:MAG: PD-(D/E)XK nuclease family protein [Roseburia sp.]|nr:PD-(D/E)XK nuclease family protein [Roseburia sp.]
MALQFIVGSAGSGKSTFLYDMISREAAEHRDKQYFILVPDQFTLETQKTFVEKSGGRGILNIDVLSFQRMAFRVFEQFPARMKTILEDMGKTMLLRKVFAEQKDRLTYFKRGIDKPGFLDECKSFLCELEQYGLRKEEDFEKLMELGKKFEDIRWIYDCFKEKMGDTYMMAEELTVQLTDIVQEMEGIRGSVICLDGFTGFTPTQYELIARLMGLCQDIYITVTTDLTGRRGHIFGISGETIASLTKVANAIPIEVGEPVVTGKGKAKKPYRFKEDGELAFLEKNIFCYPADTWNKKTEDICLYVGKKPQDEAVYVARTIWWMTVEQGYRFEDIAVITGDIPSYEHVLSREFSKMGIRYFMDDKKSIGANWVAEYIQAVLEMLQKNMDYESTFRFLRCGLSPLSKEETDCLENYVLAAGKRGFSSYDKEWKRQIRELSLEEINASRSRLCDSVRELFEDFKGKKKTVGEYTKALYSFLVRQEVYERMLSQSEVFEAQGEDILAKEYRSVYKVVMNLFDEMIELLGEETVDVEEYRQILSAGLSEGLVGFIPPKKNQVVIGDIERTRLKDIKVLFFVGFSDDLVPGKMQPPGIINARERRKIEQMGISLAPSGRKKAANDLFYLYLNFTKPSDKLIFTYSESNAGGEMRQPSYVLGKIQNIFTKLTTEYAEHFTEEDEKAKGILGTDRGLGFLISGFSKESCRTGADRELWWELWKDYRSGREKEWISRAFAGHIQGNREGKLSEKALQQLYGEELYGSITRLEQFAKCPYSYFIMYGLSLKEREEYTVEAPDFGNVVHYTLKEISDEMRAKNLRWRDLDEEKIASMVSECVDRTVGGYRDVLFHQSHRIEYMITRIKRMMNRTIWAISEQMRRGAFEQEYCEAGFSYHDNLPSMKIHLDGEKKLVFSGVIDRIDIYEDEDQVYVKVVDYKTGGIKLSLNSVFHGLQMQLVLYMAAALDMEKSKKADKAVVPAGMFYYYVKDPVLRFENPEEEADLQEQMLGEYKCNGYANERAGVLQKLDSVFGVGGELSNGAKSQCIPVNITSKGEMGRYAKVMSDEKWEQLIRHTTKMAADFGQQIMEGRIHVQPYSMRQETGCDYCSLQSICGMERAEFADKCRELEEKNEEEIWKALSEEEDLEGGGR